MDSMRSGLLQGLKSSDQLMSDQGNPDKKRLFTSLGVRLGLGACLILVILYGVMTGQLGQQNPWDPGPSNTEEAALQD